MSNLTSAFASSSISFYPKNPNALNQYANTYPHQVNAVESDQVREQIKNHSVEDLATLRSKYPYVFGDTKTPTVPPRDSGVRMHIRFNGQYKRTKFYNCARHMEQHAIPTLKELEAKGVIKRCLQGAYCALMLVVMKKNGKPRPVYDYRDLNSVTEPYYPYYHPRRR